MTESTDTTPESLSHLFSVKARSSKVVPFPVSDQKETTSYSSNSLKINNEITPATTISNRNSSIMKEARRELGRDYTNRQNANSSDAVHEEQSIANAIDKVLKKRNESITDIQRADLIVQLKQDLTGWGLLQKLIDNPEVTDIHCYDHQTVVIQRGKESDETDIKWQSQQAYASFIDRLLLTLDKSLSTQQHTIDVSLANGIRICAIHESVCGSRGPYLSIRIPRIINADINSVINYQMAPPEIVSYLGALVKSGKATIIISGETGTGKTTLLRCLSTLFGAKESIVSVEDTPEVNCQHRFYRCLVSRPANTEGVGEVSLQEHIQTTLRMTPTRVILGEMRSPYAAEAFLESAQTGHVGMSTIHARNARETIVRLESLLGRAQKSVSTDIIRHQIALAVDVIVWIYREKGTGKPRIGEIIELAKFVEGSIQVRPMFTYAPESGRPAWRVESWNSQFDEELQSQGVSISSFPSVIHFETQGSYLNA